MTNRTAEPAANRRTEPEPSAMHAIVQNAHGNADVLRLTQIPKPTPGKEDVLVRVSATSLHAGDVILMKGVR